MTNAWSLIKQMKFHDNAHCLPFVIGFVEQHWMQCLFPVSGKRVRLRDFTAKNPWSERRKYKSSKKDRKLFFKTSPCWFFTHHPDGCPRSAIQCSYAHGENELNPLENSPDILIEFK